MFNLPTLAIIAALKPVLYLLGTMLVIFIIPQLIIGYFRHKRYQKWLATQKTLNDLIYKLRPEEFEGYVGVLLNKLGYEKVKVIGGVHQADGGFDVKAEKDGQIYYVQVKKYGLKHPVHVQQVREFYGALKADHPEAKGIFITTSYFTYRFLHSAEVFAKKVGIELVDGKKLVEMMEIANASNAKI